MYELIVRINGTQAAFAALGRNRTRRPKVCTSVSVFLFFQGKRIHHTLLDVGPGVCEAIQADDLYPPAFPLDRLVLSHSHSDHFLDLDSLCGDLHWWYKRRNVETRPIPLLCFTSTYRETVETHFPFQKGMIDHTPAEPGRAHLLWHDGHARLEVTLVEVAHFRQSAVSVFAFTDGQGRTARAVCLFDFGDFYPPGSYQARAGGSPENPLFQAPELLIAEATAWNDTRKTVGKAGSHVSFEKLSRFLMRWQPRQTRIVHYAGYEDMWGDGGPANYQKRLDAGLRLHPRQGPAASWELTHAMQAHLSQLGHPNPHSVITGQPGETFVVYPPV